MPWIILVLIIVLTGCSAIPTSFTPANPLTPAEFSHHLFGQVLASHVRDGLVDYPGIQADNRLPTYLEQLDRVDPNALATRNDRLAFWINTYNAFAIKGHSRSAFTEDLLWTLSVLYWKGLSGRRSDHQSL